MQNVFVYGSLLFTELAEKLCEKSLEMKAASLSGYKRFSLKAADYPAIIPDKTSTVDGKLITNLSKEDLDILTFYEGDEYLCTHVLVRTENDEIMPALAFTWIAGTHHLAADDWNPDDFKKEALEYYLNDVIPETLKAFSDQNSPF